MPSWMPSGSRISSGLQETHKHSKPVAGPANAKKVVEPQSIPSPWPGPAFVDKRAPSAARPAVREDTFATRTPCLPPRPQGLRVTSQHLEQPRGAHAAADAHRDDDVLRA